MTNRDFIDNIDGNTLAKALREFVGSPPTGSFAEPTRKVGQARIATAFFSPGGFERIAPAIADIPDIRLLLGTDPLPDPERWQRRLDETETRFMARRFRERLDDQIVALRIERDQMPFRRTTKAALVQLVTQLRAGNMEVRRFEDNFLHAKAYIFTPTDADEFAPPEGVIVGSSNLTSAGLTSNMELNIGRYDAPTVARARDWFDQLWDKAVPFDLAAMFEEPFVPRTPYEIFLRVLWELYGDDIIEEAASDDGLPLTSFQQHGVVRALRLIADWGGAIVADEVGLGKTFIAGEIIRQVQQNRQRALLICPAAVRDTTWRRFASDHEMYLDIVSFDQLANDAQFTKGGRAHLDRSVKEYQLVVIDEAHNYRNPSAPSRAGVLRDLLYGQRKDLLLLTATPVNNSLWDLYHLTRFFLRQDSDLSKRGIMSIRERFNEAMRVDPMALSPDHLFPIIDATTVKRTRQFIKKHYSGDTIRDANGEQMPIVFPQPVALSLRYDLEDLVPGLFALIQRYLDPDEEDRLTFARYGAEAYHKHAGDEERRQAMSVSGLLRSGLLKRFESSGQALYISVGRMIAQHQKFLEALDGGHVVSTDFFKELSAGDEEDFEGLLESSEHVAPVADYNAKTLRCDVEADLERLNALYKPLDKMTPDLDPKLRVLVEAIEDIVKNAESDATTRQERINNRKILIFSSFGDTVEWIHAYLKEVVATKPELEAYRGRVDMIVGSGIGRDRSREGITASFAPNTAGHSDSDDLIDILVSTDVLAEGVNLQQARQIINYDMPWNPMRLVQRHGRIDRINSRHKRVFLRTIFPTKQLDELLKLEERIASKIAMAAVSVGVVSPVESARGRERVFAETREEIEKLIGEDPSLYERGGTRSSVQSGEEYRHTLRKALHAGFEHIKDLPWKVGSGMTHEKEQGIVFLARVGDRRYIRFLRTDDNWKINLVKGENGNLVSDVEGEVGYCLRLLECEETEMQTLPKDASDAAFDLWALAQTDILNDWQFEADPRNQQPKIRKLNREVIDHLRTLKFGIAEQPDLIGHAVAILKSPWPRQDERNLKEWFAKCDGTAQTIKDLIDNIKRTGLQPFVAPDPLPDITTEDIKLICWMAISPNARHSTYGSKG